MTAIRTLRPRTRVPAAVALPLLLVNLVALQGCDVVTAELRHSETAEWRKTYELAPGGRVQISNVNGKIRSRAIDGDERRGRRPQERQRRQPGGREGSDRANRNPRGRLAVEH